MTSNKNLIRRVSLGCLFAFLCSIPFAFSQHVAVKSDSPSKEKAYHIKPRSYKRLIDCFAIGEKSVEKNATPDMHTLGVRERYNFDDINAFSIIDIKFDNRADIFSFLLNRYKIVLMIAELRKYHEKTWNRIIIINKYTKKVTSTPIEEVPSLPENNRGPGADNTAVQPTTQAPDATKKDNAPATEEAKKATATKAQDTAKKDDAPVKEEAKKTPATKAPSSSAGQTSTDDRTRIKPFWVAPEILSDNPYIKEGDYVQVFFFNAGGKDNYQYQEDLGNAYYYSRPLASIDSQEIYLVTTGSRPEKYSAKWGDSIRLRFLRAEYPILYKPGPQQRADFISVEDEDFFIYKEYGIKFFVSPVAVYGSMFGSAFDSSNFNLVQTNPSVGSNIYLIYEGENRTKKLLNYLPGIHLSLLELSKTTGTKFTCGLVTPILPALRGYFGAFFGLYDLKSPVFGITFSPDISFKAMVGLEKETKSKTGE